MGYYSTICADVKVKPEKLKEFKRAVEKLKRKRKKETDRAGFWTFIDYFLQDMIIEDDGCLNWDECYQKWYESGSFALFIEPYMEANSKVIFIGEDGERWGYEFDGEGNIGNIHYVEETEWLPKKNFKKLAKNF